jgi:Uncharacterized protein conserved in bacteria (DUF2314)
VKPVDRRMCKSDPAGTLEMTAALQGRFAKNRKWDFHVKLGLPTESDGDGPGGAEHLWFDVHEATAKSVDGTLLNQPFTIASLRQGHRGTFDLRLLTDWPIESPRGRYTPESVLQLGRGLANDRVSARPVAPLGCGHRAFSRSPSLSRKQD